jgi:broad specificity phosphatase PhoE
MEDLAGKKLYLVRHGETEPNRLGIIQGSGLDAPLNARGIQQANDFFLAYRHIPFDVVYTSALVRTHQSVAQFLQSGRRHEVRKDLNEISWGVKDGTRIDPKEQIVYNRMLRDWQAGLLDRGFELGESPNQVAKRLQPVIEEIQKSPARIVLMCIHGRAMRILLCLLLKRPLAQMETFLHSNLCLYVLVFDGNVWRLELENDTQHLQF